MRYKKLFKQTKKYRRKKRSGITARKTKRNKRKERKALEELQRRLTLVEVRYRYFK